MSEQQQRGLGLDAVCSLLLVIFLVGLAVYSVLLHAAR